MKKKMLAILMSLAVALPLVACSGTAESGNSASSENKETGKSTSSENSSSESAGENKSGDEVRIGFSLKTVQEEFWQRSLDAIEDYADEMGITLITQIANNDSSTQISQIENLATQDIDVLMVVAVDGGTLSNTLNAVHEQGIKILLYDQEVTNTYADAFIGYDTTTIGIDIAGAIADLDISGNYVFLHGDASSGDNVTRMIEGEKSLFEDKIESGDIKVVAEQWCTGWTAEQAQAHMENALTANNNDIQAVICMNDNIAAGAINALEAAGIEDGKVPVAGMDGELTALQRIASGQQYSTLFKPAKRMAQLGMETAVQLAKGEEIKTDSTKNYGVNDMPWVVDRGTTVTAENLDEIVIDEGYFTHEEIYGE